MGAVNNGDGQHGWEQSAMVMVSMDGSSQSAMVMVSMGGSSQQWWWSAWMGAVSNGDKMWCVLLCNVKALVFIIYGKGSSNGLWVICVYSVDLK